MAAPKGNQFWLQRSKHGRDKLFETPELMLQAATEYFQWCIDNPWIKHEAIKGGERAGELISIPIARPFTIEGLCSYFGCNKAYIRQFESELKDKPNTQINKDFSTVITHIREIIYQQKFEGAAVGAFNANIIARDLGLTDRKELNNTGVTIVVEKELNDKLDKL
jgi:hypothetical protein